MTDPPTTEVPYAERLPVPVVVWAVVLVLDATLAVALGAALGAAVGWVVLAVTWVASAFGLRAAGGRIRVADGTLAAGPARLPLAVVGDVTALDAEAARRLRGTGADGRAYLWLKGWVPTAVRVDLADADDPTPYWYVSTRHPEDLAAALERGRGRERDLGA